MLAYSLREQRVGEGILKHTSLPVHTENTTDKKHIYRGLGAGTPLYK